MALTITVMAKSYWGDKKVVLGEVAFDASYPTGGEDVTGAGLTDNFLTSADLSYDLSVFLPTDGYTFELDSSNSKLKAFTTAHTEVSNATDLSSRCAHVPFLIIGT